MNIADLAGKNVCVLGYGKEGRAAAAALEKHAKGCSITIADRDALAVKDVKKHSVMAGEKWLTDLEKYDVILKSPGIHPLPEFKAVANKMTSATQVFFDSIEGSDATVVGVTGSKGKSTTASLLHHILSSGGKKSVLIGNIGEPAISHIGDATKDTVFVFEMSSYQLMDLTKSPTIAVVTSFFPEHLDYHGSVAAYLEAKKHIARFQKKDDSIYFHAASPACKEIAEESKGAKHPFSDIDAPVLIEETKLKGTHNLGNIAAAFLVAEQLGVTLPTCIDAIKSFTPLTHRLESLGVHGGVEWINDSISTTPQSAIAALDALGDRVETIILGGQDRGYDFSPLVTCLKTSNVKAVILLPDSGTTIGSLMKKAGLKIECMNAKTMTDAVAGAKKYAKKDTIVLLSPASPSYGHFKNFEDRGEQFKKAVSL